MAERTIVQSVEFKGNGEDFSATHEAEAWARARGFCVGFMCSTEPRGLARDCSYIAKWRNLTADDKTLLEGVLVSDDPRHGPVRAELYVTV